MSEKLTLIQTACYLLEELGHVCEVPEPYLIYNTSKLVVDMLEVSFVLWKDSKDGWRVRYNNKHVSMGLRDGNVVAKRLAGAIHEALPGVLATERNKQEMEKENDAVRKAGDMARGAGVQVCCRLWHDCHKRYPLVEIKLGGSRHFVSLELPAAAVTAELLAEAKEVEEGVAEIYRKFKEKYSCATKLAD